MENNNFLQGLSDDEVLESRKKNGSNQIQTGERNHLWHVIKEVASEPIFIILVGVSIIYFVLGETDEGIYMLVALGIVTGISIFQEQKSRNAADALQKLSAPKTKVIRNGISVTIDSGELVVGDVFQLSDGDLIPTDGILLSMNDFSVNESILTGESLSIYKKEEGENPKIFQGTLVTTGSCTAQVYQVGSQTELGKIGLQIQSIKEEKTPLQIQINGFIKYMLIAGFIAFVLVFAINLYTSRNLLHALLHGLTLAMSVLPEEIPVAFATFMALGAYRMYQKKVIVRSSNTVESLGAATVICLDKTGTLTENTMRISGTYQFVSKQTDNFIMEPPSYNEVINYAMWSSESEPFDPMEISIHDWYSKNAPQDQRALFQLEHEYPLGGDSPIMTHVFSNLGSNRIIAVKGSIEGVLKQCSLNQEELKEINKKVSEFTNLGYRVLGVAKGKSDLLVLPDTQFSFEFDFVGLIAFYDPPKSNIKEVLANFYKAGIQVKMITGDHPQTAIAIANQIGLPLGNEILSGNDVREMDLKTLSEKVKTVSIFTRMFPDAKLKIIEALKANGEIVAMTGDGVNDGPALKAAHIGIAMGGKGSDVARNTASLILMDDDLWHLIDAIALGRRIYENLKKAIRYIVSIHIPIILIVALSFIVFNINIEVFSPIHVIFLELIMGPTCSIIFENEPIEANSMEKKPRSKMDNFFSIRELSVSIIQGLVISISCLGLGYFYYQQTGDETLVRTIVFSTLVFSNVFLTLANRSFYFSIFTTIRYSNKLVPIILSISILFLAFTLFVPYLQHLFKLTPLNWEQLAFVLAASSAGVLWIEIHKWRKRKNDLELSK
ncbi:MAG: cation-translocating P-type ATPase [Bacteroidia bacterium]|nr:cation-translocating P-type ATPase [Bacteroidia bacterium]MCF8425315.1 cation-translocating P-type ATPase [Bacteroidia bacterium]MCF8446108.1 cation-translocating P-type ATPase [Bacteroidia bacterium]